MKPRQLVHRGTVQAAALWIDESIVGTTLTRQRILAMPGVDEVRRMENGLFVRLRNPAWITCAEAPGVPLVVCRGILLGAPLDAEELDELAAAKGTVILVRGGETIVFSPESCPVEDLASWVDLSDWSAESVEPLGQIWRSPQQALVVKEVNPREIAGIPALSPEAVAVMASLQGKQSRDAEPNPKRWGASILTSLSTWLSSIAAKLGRSRAVSPGQTASSRALVAIATPQEPRSAWADRLRMMLNSAAARLLIWARLASWIGRRQADYLEKTFSLFDSGNLEEALKHAIPLGTGSDKPKPLALDVPTPRADLSIHATKTEATSALGFGGDVFEALRRRYRKAVEQLEKQGKIKEAAFVLAELLGASEEAVSFLEKHQEYQLAAELAEGRNLDPALVVRQWILAGNRARAVLIARRTGAFAAAVARLEPSHPEQAAVLRILWANHLAASGAYGAAVQTIWPVEKARHLARDWIERGIEIGGTIGARLLATKAWLVPEEFNAVATAIRALPQDDSDSTIETWTALGQAIVANPSSKTMRILARSTLRMLLPHAEDKTLKSLVDRLTTATEDPVLLADLRRQVPTAVSPNQVHVRVAGLLDVGNARTINEDAYLIGVIDGPRCIHTTEIPQSQPLPSRGLLLAVVDGLGGFKGAEVSASVVETISRYIQTAGHDTKTVGKALVNAVEEAGAETYRQGMKDPRFRGTGATITAAWIYGDIAWIAQVGDTRAYLLRNERLEQLTKDHSLINELISAGQMGPEEIEAFEHKNIITRALGMVERVKVDLYRVQLRDGDRLFLCTDGAHGMVRHDDLVEALRRPPNDYKSPAFAPPVVCQTLKEKIYQAGAHDNIAMIIADIRIANAPATFSSPLLSALVDLEKDETPAPTTRIITKNAADIGSMPIHDAVVLPGGRLLVALGEAGVRMLSPDGKTLVQFDQPAEHLVISDQGDRAIALIPRGERFRAARIDLVNRRSERWFDAQLEDFANTFDGSIWFVFNERGVFAIDALEDHFSSLWQTKEGDCLMGARSLDAVSFFVGQESWILDLPSFRVRARRPLPLEEETSWPNIGLAANGTVVAWVKNEVTQTFAPAMREAHLNSWTLLSEGVAEGLFPHVVINGAGTHATFGRFGTNHCSTTVFDLRAKKSCLDLHLEGATRLHARFDHGLLICADDRGRVIVVNVETGKVVGDWRI